MLLVEMHPAPVQPDLFYLQEVGGIAKVVVGSQLQGEPLAKVLVVVMPPRPSDETPKPLDI